jgi:hypothetical protein
MNADAMMLYETLYRLASKDVGCDLFGANAPLAQEALRRVRRCPSFGSRLRFLARRASIFMLCTATPICMSTPHLRWMPWTGTEIC